MESRRFPVQFAQVHELVAAVHRNVNHCTVRTVSSPLCAQLEYPQSVDVLNLRQLKDEHLGLLDLKLHDHVHHLVDDLLSGTSTEPVCCVNLVNAHLFQEDLIQHNHPGAQQHHVNLVDASLVQEENDALRRPSQQSRPSHRQSFSTTWSLTGPQGVLFMQVAYLSQKH